MGDLTFSFPRNSIEGMEQAEKNNQVYLWCCDYFLQKHEFPLLREIGEKFGFTRERARQHCEKLVERGLFTYSGKKNRKYLISAYEKIKVDNQVSSNHMENEQDQSQQSAQTGSEQAQEGQAEQGQAQEGGSEQGSGQE